MPTVDFAANELANRINDAKPTNAVVAYSAVSNRVAGCLQAASDAARPQREGASRRGLSPGSHEIGDAGMNDDEGVGVFAIARAPLILSRSLAHRFPTGAIGEV
jgi:hypothetical protein